jgi:hypothetical protein
MNFSALDLVNLADDLNLAPLEAVYLGSAMRLVAKLGKLSASQALDAVRSTPKLADYLRDRLQACAAAHLNA